MVKWVDEKVLQKYWIDNSHKYSINGVKILKSEFNTPFDAFPDVNCTLEDGSRVPAEVEWKTSDYNHGIKGINLLKENKGFLIVLQEDQNFELKQIKINKEDLARWFKDKADILLKESITEVIKEIKQRKFPKLWMYYLNASANKNFPKALEKKKWGVPKNFRQINRFKDVKAGDLVLFLGPWKPLKGTGGRVSLKKFGGVIDKFLLTRVTESHHYDDKEIWPANNKGDKWAERFGFETILKLGKINIRALSKSSKATIHHLFHNAFWDGSPFVLSELISHAEK